MKFFSKSIGMLLPVFMFAATVSASECQVAYTAIPAIWWIAPASSVLALLFAVFFYKKVMAAPEGTEKMIEIANHVREGAHAYLFSQYKVVAVVFGLFFIIFRSKHYSSTI